MTFIPSGRVRSISRSILLASSLMMIGTGCRDLKKAHEAYCAQVSCEAPDGGEPDGSETPVGDIHVELGQADAAVQGECVDVTVTTPEDAAATFSMLLESAPGADKQGPMVFSRPACGGTPEMQVEVPAGEERTLSFRAYTDWSFSDGSERHARLLELRSSEGEGWVQTAEVQIENGAFIFGPGEAPTELPPDPSSAPIVRLDGCTKIAGRLFGLESGRAARHAPGKLSLITEDSVNAGLSLVPDCSEYWTESDLDGGAGPDLPSGDALVLYIVPPESPTDCDYWLIGTVGGAQGELRVEDLRELCGGP